MNETLIEKIKQEKIIYPASQQDIGWNNAIDFILAEYSQANKAIPFELLPCGHSDGTYPRTIGPLCIKCNASQSA